MKPDAPAEYRGIWKPIRTKRARLRHHRAVPASRRKITDKFSIVRSLHHDTGDHFAGGHRMLTTKDMGVSGANNERQVPRHRRHRQPRGRPAQAGHARLRRACPTPSASASAPATSAATSSARSTTRSRPAATRTPPNFAVQNLNLAQGLTLERLEDRRTLVQHFDTARAQPRRHWPTPQAMDRFAAGGVRVRHRPGGPRGVRHQQGRPAAARPLRPQHWGQSTLLARRLVEAGSTFVTVHFGGWDHHWDLKKGMENYLPQVDALRVGAVRRTWTSAACSTRRWWCCAASSAARRR